jgi:hypothetical protein
MPNNLANLLFDVPQGVTFHSLIQFQTPAKDQGERGSCDGCSFVSAIEAAYKRKYGFNDELSVEYLIHYVFSTQPARNPNLQHENCCAIGIDMDQVFGFIPGEQLIVDEQFGLPRNADCPYFAGKYASENSHGTLHSDQDLLEIVAQSGLISFTNPGHTEHVYASPQTQAMLDAFEYDPKHVPLDARNNAWFGVDEIYRLQDPDFKTPSVLERWLYNNYEVRLAFGFEELSWGDGQIHIDGSPVDHPDAGDGQTFPPLAKYPVPNVNIGGAHHAALLVAFDQTNQRFLFKNSYDSTPYFWVPYDFIEKKMESGLVIAAIRDPLRRDEAAAWLGRWKMDWNGWQGELILRRNRESGTTLGSSAHLGTYYDEGGVGQQVFGRIDPVDNTAHLQIYLTTELGIPLVRYFHVKLFGNGSSLYGHAAAGEASTGDGFASPESVWGAVLTRPGLEFNHYPGSFNLDLWRGWFQIHRSDQHQVGILHVTDIYAINDAAYGVEAEYQGALVKAMILKDQPHRLFFAADELPSLYYHNHEQYFASGIGVVARGFNYIGNFRSKELHDPSCIWIGKARAYNKRYFATLEDAFKQGYNGCHYCLPAYDNG